MKAIVMVAAAALVAVAGCGTSDAPAGDAPATTSSDGVPATSPSTTTLAPAPPESTTTTTTTASSDAACAVESVEQPPETALSFYALCEPGTGLGPYPVYRPGATNPNLQQSLEDLVAGTTPEEQARGLAATFDFVEEAGEIEVVSAVDAAGVAQVDFRIDGNRWNPGQLASTSAQFLAMMDPLLATVFRHEDVVGLDMTTLCWGESACDGVTTRELWEGMLFANEGLLSHDGCTPERAWWFPERCTVDGVVAAGGVAPAAVVDVAEDDTLNLRAGPGTAYFRHGELAPGAAVAATTAAAEAADGGIWRLILAEEEGTGAGPGWVNEAFLDIEGTPADELVARFVDFAAAPGDETFAVLPLGDPVDLGLGPDIVATVPQQQLRLPAGWVLDVDDFRAYVGPFSAFDALFLLSVYEVSEGEHPHCASPSMPAPDGFDTHDRISVQPHLTLDSSCLEWYTVDFFVSVDGLVEAITLDIWEP